MIGTNFGAHSGLVPGGKPFFVSDSWAKFKTAVTYINQGHLSDKPGFSPYTIVRQLRDGRYWLRCLRTSSPLEGYHHHLNRAQDSMAKCAGPELQNASMRLFQFFWTLKAAITANIIPYIWHSEVHLRYRLQGQEQGRAGARPGFLAARPGWARSSCFVEMPRPGRARSSCFFEMPRACRARSSLKSGKNRAGPLPSVRPTDPQLTRSSKTAGTGT